MNNANYLDELIKNETPVMLFLINGVRLRVTIVGYDEQAVFVSYCGRTPMIYKHAISTFDPYVE